MSDVIESDEHGTLHLTGKVLGETHPHTRYEIRHEGNQLVIRRAERRAAPFWQTATPAERAAAFRQWIDRHKDGPGLSDFAVSRDSIYD